MRIAVGIIAVILIFVFGLITFLWSGQFNVSADTPHWSITESVLESVRERSINHATDDIQIPENINDQSFYAQGAGHYQAMCSDCHLAPDKTESELRMGLYPKPPAYTDLAGLEPQKTFWIVKHGLKMTGMPAWGKSHSDDKIWKIAAFVRHIKDMDKSTYLTLAAQYRDDDHHHENDHHDHAH